MVFENKLKNTNDNEQLNALKQRFYEIIPQEINTILDDVDLKVYWINFYWNYWNLKYKYKLINMIIIIIIK